jgi:HK97 family phage prohead protease
MEIEKKETKHSVEDKIKRSCLLPFEAKADQSESGKWTIKGYASVFNVLDHAGDVILPGAFSLAKKDMERNLIKVLSQHDWKSPIGKPTVIEEDSFGLYFEAVISKTEKGVELAELINDGVIDRMSIGYRILKYVEFDDAALRARAAEEDPRMVYLPFWYLQKLKLIEISPVTFAANDETSVGISGYAEKSADEENQENQKSAIISCDYYEKGLDLLKVKLQSGQVKTASDQAVEGLIPEAFLEVVKSFNALI